MKCPQCGGEIVVSLDMTVTEAAHDENKLDIIITCPECNESFNAFVDINDDFMTLD